MDDKIFDLNPNVGPSALVNFIDANESIERTQACDSIDDDFGDFADFQEPCTALKDDTFTSFAHSSTGSGNTLPVNPPSLSLLSPVLSSFPLFRTDNNVEGIILDAFPTLNDFLPGEEKLISTEFFKDNSCLSFNLWENLLNLNEASSLKLDWRSSHTFQIFLKSLKIDPYSDLNLDSLSVPTFAAGMGLLEPTKGSFSSLSSVVKSTISKADLNNLVNPENSASPITKARPESHSLGSFYHSEEKHLPSNGLDLDFFTNPSSSNNNSIKMNSKVSNLEAELLQEDGNPVKPLSIISSSSTDPLHQLISQLHNSSDISSSLHKRRPELSSEANQILEELPILSFMRAKVLMFPVNDKARE